MKNKLLFSLLLALSMMFATDLAAQKNNSKFDSDDFMELKTLRKKFKGMVKDAPLNFDFTYPIGSSNFKKAQVLYLDEKSRPIEVYVFRSTDHLLDFATAKKLDLHPLKKKAKCDCKKEGVICACDSKKGTRMIFVVED